MTENLKPYDVFNKEIHLQPPFDKATFDTLHDWDLCWELLEPINIAGGETDEYELSKRFSPGQKALYFFWYLDAEVTNGGFIQFYFNGRREYLLAVINGLKLIGDDEMLTLVQEADKFYRANAEKFEAVQTDQDFSNLYSNLNQFEEFDDRYYALHDGTVELIESYARKHPEEFAALQ